jgi:hypothetical protein
MGPGLSELMAAVAAQGVSPTGPWFDHHQRMDPDTFDFEIGVPVQSPISPAGRVQPGRLPATIVARTIYHGDTRASGPPGENSMPGSPDKASPRARISGSASLGELSQTPIRPPSARSSIDRYQIWACST